MMHKTSCRLALAAGFLLIGTTSGFSAPALADEAMEPAQGLTAVLPINIAPLAPRADATPEAKPSAEAPTVEVKPSQAVVVPAAVELKAGEALPAPATSDDRPAPPEVTTNEFKDAEGRTHLKAGARFPVSIAKMVTSKNAKLGDLVEAKLNYDLKIGDRLIAPKDTLVLGHVNSVERARKLLRAELVTNRRWLRMSGSLGIQFDEIVTAKGDHIPLVAIPATKARVITDNAAGRIMGVNKSGQVASPLSGQMKSQAIHLAIRAGAAAGGPFTMGAVPVAYAVLGAFSPSFAFCHPVGTDVKHRRLKGFGMGLVAGLPGGFLISDSIIKGPEAIVQPGDVFEAEFKQEFTGEPAKAPSIPANVDTQVHGEVIPAQK